MNGRAYVLIFFFWAVLTIITPTLILWSASAKANLDHDGEIGEGVKARRKLGYFEEHMRMQVPLAPVPAPAEAPELGWDKELNGTTAQAQQPKLKKILVSDQIHHSNE
ncbi:hypothetical protein RJ641_029014 [Dillenia turbinata]|uniref:Uncharacterized protein n=1 Tax=Dillenia turbinata TaxID=194707 RepID=A0AAN8ZMB3_9MAGN